MVVGTYLPTPEVTAAVYLSFCSPTDSKNNSSPGLYCSSLSFLSPWQRQPSPFFIYGATKLEKETEIHLQQQKCSLSGKSFVCCGKTMISHYCPSHHQVPSLCQKTQRKPFLINTTLSTDFSTL